MSDPHSRLREARKQIRLVAENLETRANADDLDEGVIEDLREAASLVGAVQDELVESEDEALTDG